MLLKARKLAKGQKLAQVMRKLNLNSEEKGVTFPTPPPPQNIKLEPRKHNEKKISKEEAIRSHINYSISDHQSFNFSHA